VECATNGNIEGVMEGATVGSTVSAVEGATIGSTVGAVEGATVGNKVGAMEGATVGNKVGAMEGVTVDNCWLHNRYSRNANIDSSVGSAVGAVDVTTCDNSVGCIIHTGPLWAMSLTIRMGLLNNAHVSFLLLQLKNIFEVTIPGIVSLFGCVGAGWVTLLAERFTSNTLKGGEYLIYPVCDPSLATMRGKSATDQEHK
jgi:hypothetical protein